jgi:hypothetical protein
MNLLDTARQFGVGAAEITEWLGSGGEIVSRELAQERAEICLECKKNVPTGVLKESIAVAVKKALDVKNRMQLRVAGEKKLGECKCCGCVLRLLVWYPQRKIQPYLTAGEIENTPGHCWKLRLP